MSTVTPKLNLVKPASPEQFSLATYNNNLDLIDGGVKTLGLSKYIEFTAPGSTYPSSSATWGPGTLTISSAVGDDTSFAAPSLNDRIKFIKPGIYWAQWWIQNGSALPDGEMRVFQTDETVSNPPVNNILQAKDLKTTASWHQTIELAFIISSANSIVKFDTINRLAAMNTNGSRIRVAKLW